MHFRLTYVICINLLGTNLMGHNSIQPWHYGFCDLSHAQSAVKESKKAAQAAPTTAAWRRGGGGAAAAFSLEEGSQG
jgi:hypothetical protein